MNFLKRKPLFSLIIAGLVLRLILLFISSSHPDIFNHLDWGEQLVSLGPKKFYENIFWKVSWPNQPYASMYLFALIKIVKDQIFNFFLYLNNAIPLFPSQLIFILEKNLHLWLVKMPFVLADLAISLLIYQICLSLKVSRKKAIISASLFLFNPSVVYNSTIWGQTDSLINLLSLTGLFLLYRKRFFSGTFVFFLSYLFKLSLIIYLPLYAIIAWHNRRYWSKIILSLLFTLSLFILFAWPFSIFPDPLRWLIYLYENRVLPRQGNMLNGNAFNLWLVFFGLDLSLSDSTPIFNIPAKTISYLFVSLLITFYSFKAIFKKPDLYRLLYLALLISFSSFLFLTNMHERYLYPILPIFPILIATQTNKKLFSPKNYLIISLIHLLNLYNLWFYPQINPVSHLLEYQQYLIPKILSIILLVYYLLFANGYLKNNRG